MLYIKTRSLQIINLISYVALVIFSFFAVRLPFFDRRPGDVSDIYSNPFTPPDFSFKIWIVIYTLLGIYAVHQAKGLFDKSQSAPKEVRSIGLLFAFSCLCNMGWLVTWQSLHLGLSFVMLFFLWASLICIYYQLAPFLNKKWMFILPFSWYLGWVAVAGLANLNVLLMAAGFDFFGFSSQVVTIFWIGVGIFGGLLVLWLNKDWWFTIVLLWALIGILVKNGFGDVGAACIIGMAILAFASLATIYQNQRNRYN